MFEFYKFGVWGDFIGSNRFGLIKCGWKIMDVMFFMSNLLGRWRD